MRTNTSSTKKPSVWSRKYHLLLVATWSQPPCVYFYKILACTLLHVILYICETNRVSTAGGCWGLGVHLPAGHWQPSRWRKTGQRITNNICDVKWQPGGLKSHVTRLFIEAPFLAIKKNQKRRIIGPLWEDPPVSVGLPHRGLVMLEAFSCHNTFIETVVSKPRQFYGCQCPRAYTAIMMTHIGQRVSGVL